MLDSWAGNSAAALEPKHPQPRDHLAAAPPVVRPVEYVEPSTPDTPPREPPANAPTAPAPAPAPKEDEHFITHAVTPRDTLEGLALRYGVHMGDIKLANDLATSNLSVVKTLRIPRSGRVLAAPRQIATDPKPAMLRTFRVRNKISESEAKYYLDAADWDVARAQAEADRDASFAWRARGQEADFLKAAIGAKAPSSSSSAPSSAAAAGVASSVGSGITSLGRAAAGLLAATLGSAGGAAGAGAGSGASAAAAAAAGGRGRLREDEPLLGPGGAPGTVERSRGGGGGGGGGGDRGDDGDGEREEGRATGTRSGGGVGGGGGGAGGGGSGDVRRRRVAAVLAGDGGAGANEDK